MRNYVLKKPKVKEVLGSETRFVPERWLYRWSGEPPYDFCLFKVLFQQRTPADIVQNGWQIVEPVVSELATCLNQKAIASRIDWLQLNRVHRESCLLGVDHQEETVAAAAPFTGTPLPFIPFRYFEKIAAQSGWHDREYSCSYRHFVTRFQNGMTFYTDRHSLQCDLEHSVHFGVHGIPLGRSGDRPDGPEIVQPYLVRRSRRNLGSDRFAFENDVRVRFGNGPVLRSHAPRTGDTQPAGILRGPLAYRSVF